MDTATDLLRPTMKKTRTYVYTICLLILYDFFENIVFSLTVSLLEHSICHQYFADSGVERDPVQESQCKIRQVQARLAFVRGLYSFCRTGPAILVGPLFGALADRLGRRLVYSLCVTGLLLQIIALYIVCIFWEVFAIQISWLTGIFILIGGGQFVIVGLNFTMIADVSSSQLRSQRLYLAFAIRYCADLISPQVAARALEHSLWLPTVIAVTCLAASYPVLLLMGETQLKDDVSTPTRTDHDESSHHGSIIALLRNRNVALCVVITFLLQFRYLTESILIVYTPVRFGWTISEITRLLSIIPGLSLVLFFALPLLQKRLYPSVTEDRKTYFVALTLTAFLVIGSFIIVAAPTITALAFALSVFAVGNGVRAPLLSIAAGFIDRATNTATLYTLLSITDALAHVVGDPLLELIWQTALNIGTPWLALPFMVTTGLFVIAFVLMLWLPSNQVTKSTDLGESDDVMRPLLEEREPST